MGGGRWPAASSVAGRVQAACRTDAKAISPKQPLSNVGSTTDDPGLRVFGGVYSVPGSDLAAASVASGSKSLKRTKGAARRIGGGWVSMARPSSQPEKPTSQPMVDSGREGSKDARSSVGRHRKNPSAYEVVRK